MLGPGVGPGPQHRGGKPHHELTLFEQVLAFWTGGFWFNTDQVDVASAKVTAWTDYKDGSHVASQGTSTRQVATPAADASLNGALSVSFTGGTPGSQSYVGNRAATAYNFIHQGPCTFLTVRVGQNQTICNFSATMTANGSTFGAGYWLWQNNNTALLWALRNATGDVATNVSCGPALGGIASLIQHSSSLSPAIQTRWGPGLTSSKAYSLTPGGNAAQPFEFGSFPGATWPPTFRLAAIAAAPITLSTDQLQTLSDYLNEAYAKPLV